MNGDPQSDVIGKIVVPGFRAGAVKAGVRYQDRLDLGLVMADSTCPAAGVFTKNRVAAPSVLLDKDRLRSGKARAVLVNSGNANACVGPRGMADAVECVEAVARAAGIGPGLVLMNSTGVIGEPLPKDRILAAVPELFSALTPEGLGLFARAIMTTDTKAKMEERRIKIGGKSVTLAGAAKGAGMIMPNLATMLVYILTDAKAKPKTLKAMLKHAVQDSFNALTIDGDTSTSDSVILMASGASEADVEKGGAAEAFQAALNGLCMDLARAIAADGEGATRMFMVTAKGARTEREADKVARRVANSLLIKTAFHAGDPNWGRVMMAIGSAGVALDPGLVKVSFVAADKKRVEVVSRGAVSPAYSERDAARILSGDGFTIEINLGRGNEHRTILTCDLSADYVRINADYRS